MAVPGVNFTIAPAHTPTPHSVDDVVFLVGRVGAGSSGTIADGTFYEGDTLADLATILGTDGHSREFLAAVLGRVSPHVIYQPVGLAGDATAITNALATVYDAGRTPTVLHVAGDFTAPSDSPAVNAIVTALETHCEALNCRAVANAAQDTVANAVAWGNNNGKPRVIGVFNQGGSSGAYTMPAGPWLGAALAQAEEHGRAWGINLARVTGQTGVRHALSPYSSNLVTLDAAGVSSIVSDNGILKIVGDEFKTASDTDPQRFWSIARVVDHVEERLTAAARAFISSTYSADRIAIHLTRELNPLIAAGEILGGSVVPDLEHEQGTHKYLIAELDLLFATAVITVRLNLVV